MNFAGSLRGFGALPDGPCAALLFAVRQKADEAQQLIAGLDEVVQTGVLNAHLLQKRQLFLRRGLRNVLLSLGADGQRLRVLGGGAGGHQRVVGIALQPAQQVVLAHVAGVDDRLGREQPQLLAGDGLAVVPLVKGKGAGGLFRLQMGGQLRQPGGLGGSGFVAGLGGLLLAAKAVVHHLQIGQNQL